VSIDEVNIVKVQALQTRVHALDQMLPAQSAVVDWVVAERTAPVQLCADDEVVALPAELLDSTTHALLALAAGVALTG